MHNSVLRPPGRQDWNNGVIGNVVPRSRAPPRGLVAVSEVTKALHTSERIAEAPDTTQPASEEPGNPSGKGQQPTKSRPEVSAELALRRQRRRASMARYRKKQNNRAAILEKDVRLLREEVQKLEVQCKSVAPQVSAEMTPWGLAAEYFRLFRHGSPALVPSSAGMLYTSEAEVQREFIQATMSPDVLFGNTRGVEAHLEIWRLCALYHQDFDIQLEQLEIGAGNSLVATTTSRATITIDTLRHAFPRLVQQDQEGNWSSLVSRLLGKELVVLGSTSFQWDEREHCVASVIYTADVLTALLHHLGNLEDVCSAFDNARVTPEGKFTEVEALQEAL